MRLLLLPFGIVFFFSLSNQVGIFKRIKNYYSYFAFDQPLVSKHRSSIDQRSIPEGMVLIKGGTFEIGDVMRDSAQRNESIQAIKVDKFLLAKNELTFDEFDAFCNATGRKLIHDQTWGRGQSPIQGVIWYDAIEYCNWRSVQEGLKPVYIINKEVKDTNNLNTYDQLKWQITVKPKTNGYRLPTEAEWEFAAREGGRKVRFGNGKDIANPKEINFNGAPNAKKSYSEGGVYRRRTLPVGSLNSPNALGLHDMSGNVWEWCWDWYDSNYISSSNPLGARSGLYRVTRGASWAETPSSVRVAYRGRLSPHGVSNMIGFRLAKNAPGL